MPADSALPHNASILTLALHWAYDQAIAAIPGLGTAADLAERHLRKCGGARERAVSDLIAWQVTYAGGAGFLTNLGGLVALPVTLPANLASTLLIQVRMIAAIAHLNGHDVDDERVRTLAFVCLTGSAALEELNLGGKVSASLLKHVSAATLSKINHAVGFRLIGKTGSRGLLNLTKLVPILGGVAGGALDASVTYGIAAVARKVFPPVVAGEAGADIEILPPAP